MKLAWIVLGLGCLGKVGSRSGSAVALLISSLRSIPGMSAMYVLAFIKELAVVEIEELDPVVPVPNVLEPHAFRLPPPPYCQPVR